MPDSNLVQIDLKEGVLSITLNHPKANAFTDEMITALQAAFKQAGRETQVRSVLLSGSGNFFSTGRDLNDVSRAAGESFRGHLLRTFNPLIMQIRSLEKPVIAAINGAVAGAGLGIALACDLRIASKEARFVVGFLGIGLAPDSAVSLLLPALITDGRRKPPLPMLRSMLSRLWIGDWPTAWLHLKILQSRHLPGLLSWRAARYKP
jgi:2-(1,2-epoxy-1,2-dihydrophenyl)acetyl-CoA isomerase